MATRTARAPSEQDTRLGILNTLLTTPHRKLELVHPIHADMITKDPLFYAHLGAWYEKTGEIRDHKECFVINLCLSDFEGHRDVGLAMLRELPPYEVVRVVDFVHGKRHTKKLKAKKGEEAKVEITTTGLERNPTRSMITEVTRYLKEREADDEWFDACILQARSAMKRLYALLHIKPSERANDILFKGNPPKDSKLFAMKELAKASTPAEQAKTIVENKIPYRVAATVVSAMTPTVLLALIEVMSPQELINNLGSLKKRGAFDNPETKALIEGKLVTAKTGKRVSALKGKEALKVANLSEETTKQLEDIADTQVKSKGRIKKSTAIFIDKSGSMEQAIELGKQIAAMVSAVAEGDLYVYAFDTMAYPITPVKTDLASWDKALRGIAAGGGTACGVPLLNMMRANQKVEQIILVTDEGENGPTFFYPTLAVYREKMGIDPSVVIVKTQGAINQLEMSKPNNVTVDAWQFSGDYTGLPGLITFLSRPGKAELLMDIMSFPLPERRPG